MSKSRRSASSATSSGLVPTRPSERLASEPAPRSGSGRSSSSGRRNPGRHAVDGPLGGATLIEPRAADRPQGRASAIGIMGGTFDPIHVGHLAIAEEAREALALDRVLFVPAGQPPHKPPRSVSRVDDRVAMVQLAIADNPAFELSMVEVEREGPSFTVDTVEALAGAYPGVQLHVILSAETFAELPSWHEPERLFDAARMAVVPREGYPAPDPAWLARAFPGREG